MYGRRPQLLELLDFRDLEMKWMQRSNHNVGEAAELKLGTRKLGLVKVTGKLCHDIQALAHNIRVLRTPSSHAYSEHTSLNSVIAHAALLSLN